MWVVRASGWLMREGGCGSLMLPHPSSTITHTPTCKDDQDHLYDIFVLSRQRYLDTLLMDSPSYSSSQPNSPDEVESSSQDSATDEAEPHCICYGYSRVYPRKPSDPSVYPWNDFVVSAHTCSCCDVIVRGCRGWLDEDGKQDWVPDSLTLHLRYSAVFRAASPRAPIFVRHIVIKCAMASIKLEVLVKNR